MKIRRTIEILKKAEWKPDREKNINKDILRITKNVIGNINERIYLVIDENRKIYSLYGGSVMVIGEDPDNTLNNLFSKG